MTQSQIVSVLIGLRDVARSEAPATSLSQFVDDRCTAVLSVLESPPADHAVVATGGIEELTPDHARAEISSQLADLASQVTTLQQENEELAKAALGYILKLQAAEARLLELANAVPVAVSPAARELGGTDRTSLFAKGKTRSEDGANSLPDQDKDQ